MVITRPIQVALSQFLLTSHLSDHERFELAGHISNYLGDIPAGIRSHRLVQHFNADQTAELAGAIARELHLCAEAHREGDEKADRQRAEWRAKIAAGWRPGHGA